MKSSDILLLVLVIILGFIAYHFQMENRMLQRELQECQDHPIENAIEYITE